jgi:hypothetical protein
LKGKSSLSIKTVGGLESGALDKVITTDILPSWEMIKTSSSGPTFYYENFD